MFTAFTSHSRVDDTVVLGEMSSTFKFEFRTSRTPGQRAAASEPAGLKTQKEMLPKHESSINAAADLEP